ncbi:MAG TPA: preprotein translocase subunit YajC [Candidatus Binataceae bacterium]|jgi:preprotein translocase subunit YajC|nr:preprotein translocase subunit YajC [Candidatus Binataceae bacterium]
MFFEGIAWAQNSAAPGAPGAQAPLIDQLLYGPGVPFALLILAFYWFFLRPQTTKAREHRDLLAKLKRNDEVVTAGGLLGRINEVGDKVIVLEIAPNVRVRVERSQITALSSYGKPALTKKAEQ